MCVCGMFRHSVVPVQERTHCLAEGDVASCWPLPSLFLPSSRRHSLLRYSCHGLNVSLQGSDWKLITNVRKYEEQRLSLEGGNDLYKRLHTASDPSEPVSSAM